MSQQDVWDAEDAETRRAFAEKDAEIERLRAELAHAEENLFEAGVRLGVMSVQLGNRDKLHLNQLQIGPYALSLIWVPEGSQPPFTQVQHVMIRHQSGEAMSVRESVFAELIGKFYKENF